MEYGVESYNPFADLNIRIKNIKTEIKTKLLSNPNETKANPIAHPALKATLNAGANPRFAQYVVRKFVWVAINIPTAPQIIETIAPTANEIAV